MALELKIPSVGESVTEVTISQWLVEDGQYVEMDQPVAELESDKATVELNAEAAGAITLSAAEGDDVEVGAVVATIDTSAEAPAKTEAPAKEELKKEEAPKEEPKTEAKESSPASDNGKDMSGVASPAAKKILAEKGMSPEGLRGTGKEGRITKADAMGASPQMISSGGMSLGSGNRDEHREKMSNLRKTVSRRLVAAKNETAMLTTFNEADMKPIMDIRKVYKEKFREKHEVGLGFMSFFTRACTLALQEFPAVNAYIDGTEIIFHDYVDISIAVSGPKGLMVPVIRNAESLRMHEIEGEVVRLAKKARDGKLSIDEMTGGTFTISNGGVFGSMMSTPIINPPQSAILGMHNIIERPVVVDGEIVVRPMMYLALSYDHRIIDGRESVSFLVRVKEYLENPLKMLSGQDPTQALLDL